MNVGRRLLNKNWIFEHSIADSSSTFSKTEQQQGFETVHFQLRSQTEALCRSEISHQKDVFNTGVRAVEGICTVVTRTHSTKTGDHKSKNCSGIEQQCILIGQVRW